MNPIVAVLFALGREAAPFRRAVRQSRDVHIALTGVGARAGAVAAEVIARHGPSRLVMAGFCGALRTGLAVGDVVRPAEGVDEAGNLWPCASGGAGRLVTTSRIAATPDEKHALHARHSADIVDMESAAVAAACAAGGVPFVAVRAVSDAVDAALSPELVRLLAGGRVSVWKACAALVRRPALLGEFRRLARDTRLAARTLAAALVPVAVGA